MGIDRHNVSILNYILIKQFTLTIYRNIFSIKLTVTEGPLLWDTSIKGTPP